MKRKLSAALLSMSLIGGLLAGCGSSDTAVTDSSPSTETGSEEVTLTFAIWSDEENYIRKVVDQYNAEERGITVDLQVIPEADYDDKLKVMLSGGAGVDLVDIRGVSQTTLYASQGSILNITDYISNSGLDTSQYGDMWETSKYEDGFYALPTRSTCWVLYYNADLFDQAGIPYPEQLTWEEYGDLAVKLQEKLNVYGGYWVPWIFQFASVQSGKYVDNSDTSGLRYSLELLNRFYNVDQSHMSYADITATSADYIAEFENGKCAMLPNGEWCVNMFLEDEASGESTINWQVAPMPVPEGVEDHITWGQFQFAAITANSTHPDEAFDFLSYLCGAEGSEVYSSCGMIHAYASDNSREAYIETTGRDSVSVFFDAEKIQEAPNTDSYNEILNAFNEHAQLYLLGETDIDTCISNFTAQRDSILAEYK